MHWKTVAEHTPSSATMPVWICDNEKKFDLVYLTDDEKYFVSTDHKRVYPANTVLWSIVDTPVACEVKSEEFDSNVVNSNLALDWERFRKKSATFTAENVFIADNWKDL